MCKPAALEDLAKLWTYKKNQTEITSRIAYLIGVKEEYLGQFFEDDADRKKLETETCMVIRNLCMLRTKLLTNYTRTESAFRYELMNLDRMELYKDEVKALEKCGVSIIKANYRVNKYIVDINSVIANRIDTCRTDFPDWIEWKYIKKMFIMPNGTKENKIVEENKKFLANRQYYPFGCYVNWDPKDEGNVLISDKKFLISLYAQNYDYFTGMDKVTDAADSIKTGIYDFIDRNEVIDVVVDCENSDAYRLYSTLRGLNEEEISRINKIILYDDVHTTSAWKLLTDEFQGVITFEYVLVKRLNESKSLVDHRMIADISKEHYRENVDAFIIVSSDSDYWAIINSIDDAGFLVMVEKEKVGNDIIAALDEKGIFYCYLNDFCMSKVSEFENRVLHYELRKRLDHLIDLNAFDLLRGIYRDARITSGDAEKESFYNKHIKTLKLSIDECGTMRIV